VTFKKAVKEKGLKLNWIADRAEIDRSYLYLILTEQRTPSSEVVLRLTEAVWGKDANKQKLSVLREIL
jgi:predicted transcriptional regulator